MDGNVTLHIRHWPMKDLACLLPAATCTSTAVIAILGIFSNPRVPWSRRLVLALLLHPMNALQGYVVMFFSMVNISDFVNRPNCSKLIHLTVISYVGVTVSTLAISLWRSSQLLLAETLWAWPSRMDSLRDSTGCSVSVTLAFVLAVHTFTLTVAHVALPNGFWGPLTPHCTEFFTSAETTIPFIHISAGFIGTSLLLLALSTILLAYSKNRRSQHSSTVIEIEDTSQGFTFIPPPDDGSHRPGNRVMIASVPIRPNRDPVNECPASGSSLALEHRNLQVDQNRDNGSQYVVQERIVTNENNNRFNRRPEDFYDYERRRHRVQSPPPMDLNHIRQANRIEAPPQQPMNEFRQVEQTNPTQVPPLHTTNRQHTTDVNEIRNNESNIRHNSISSSVLGLIFPHRNTIRNKNRFTFTKVEHTRHLQWSIRNYQNVYLFLANHEAFMDYAICISNLLYCVSYSLLACYLIYSSKETPNPFLSSSLQPFISLCMVKGTLESILYVALINMYCL